MKYEAKYRRFITKSQSRYAEHEEIVKALSPVADWAVPMAAGVPLYYDGDTMYVDSSDSHTIVVGPTGCKKTRVTVFPAVCSIIDAGESAVINDPKGEIYRRTAARAEAAGADIMVLNFREPEHSHQWNPLYQAKRFYDDGRITEAFQCVNDFVSSIASPSLFQANDRYWVDTAVSYLNAVILMMLDSLPAEYFNISNLIKFSYQENRAGMKVLLKNMDQNSTAATGLHTVIDLEAEKTYSCIYSTIMAILSPFVQNPKLLESICDNDIDIGMIGKKQTLIYVIYPDEKSSLNFLVNAFFTQCYETLISIAAAANDRLPVRVNFVIDEFSNLPAINNFENRISEARSRNIRYLLFIQSYDQLRQKYKECAETIMANCSNWVCFGSKEIDFLKNVSEICGREVDYNGIEHPLISPYDMQNFEKYDDGAEVLIIKQGLNPYVVKLTDIDYIERYKGMALSDIHAIDPKRTARFLTFNEWIAGISIDRFKFPYAEIQ